MMDLFMNIVCFIVGALTYLLAFILHPINTYRLTRKCARGLDENMEDDYRSIMIYEEFVYGIIDLITK